MSLVSIVIPVYNVQEHIQRFVYSLQNQTLKDFEALFIDNASTDDSLFILNKLAGKDLRIKILKQTVNLGAGAARNIGIQFAKGETLCFADPDDFLPECSLEVRYKAFKKHNAVVRACHNEVSFDGTVIHSEICPLKMDTALHPQALTSQLGINPFLCAHWTWLFPTKMVQRLNILNKENTRTAEDIIFLVRLFFNISRFVWIPDIVYFWIKRKDSLSTVPYTAEHYLNYFDCVDEFYAQSEKHKNINLADIFCNNYLRTYFSHLMNQILQQKSSEEDASKLFKAVNDICIRYGALERVNNSKSLFNNYAGFYWFWLMLKDTHPLISQRLINSCIILQQEQPKAFHKNIQKPIHLQVPILDKFDSEQSIARVRYFFCNKQPTEIYYQADKEILPLYTKNRVEYKQGDTIIFERILWLPVPKESDVQLKLILDGKNTNLNYAEAELKNIFSLDEDSFPEEVIVLRRLAKSPVIQNKFKKAWLFIDRDTQADDNAEHLYRWIMLNQLEINIYFVLNQDSHDWHRLKTEGFKLIAFGSIEHKVLYLLAEKLISSQIDCYIFAYLEDSFYSDIRKSKFICLQHGVIKEDISCWLNSAPFDLFITTTKQEYDSIVNDNSGYLMTKKEVCLTGLPRYDKWLESCEQEKMIFVMPTWRADLVGSWDGKGQRREINQDFYKSLYVKMWQDVFEDKRLKNILNTYGYRIVFFAHTCFEDYLDKLPFPEFVEKRSKIHGSIINIMQKSKVMITDFSSIAYDMAYMLKPVIYYQYESKEKFVKSQGRVSGYFDYQEIGFGPVCYHKQELFNTLEQILQENCIMQTKYINRVNNTFPYRDANCCQRVFEAILTASQPTANKGCL